MILPANRNNRLGKQVIWYIIIIKVQNPEKELLFFGVLYF